MSQCTHFMLETNYAFLFTISNNRNVGESNYIHQKPFLYVSVLRVLVNYQYFQVSYISYISLSSGLVAIYSQQTQVQGSNLYKKQI